MNRFFLITIQILLYVTGFGQNLKYDRLLYSEQFEGESNDWISTTFEQNGYYDAFVDNDNLFYFGLPEESAWGFTWIGVPEKIRNSINDNDRVLWSTKFKGSSFSSQGFCFGIMFNLLNVTQSCPGGDFYLISIRSLNNDGDVRLSLTQRKNCSWLRDFQISGDTVSINSDSFNDLTIIKNGQTYYVYINNTQALSFVYKDKLSPKLYYEKGKYTFDDVYVYSLKTDYASDRAMPDSGKKTVEIVDSELTDFQSPTSDIFVGKNYALIVGVALYDNFNDLPNSLKGAEVLKKALTSDYRFEESDILFLANPTKTQIELAFDKLYKEVDEEDNLLIFFSGHNELIQDKGYWVLKDSKSEGLSSYFANESLKDYLRNIKSNHILVISDACFGGSLIPKNGGLTVSKPIKELYRLKSKTLMASSNLTEAYDNTIFVDNLVRALRENREPQISSDKLFSSFRMLVLENGARNQVPIYARIPEVGHEGGEFILFRR